MWPPATSTTIPSGSLRPSLTMIFRLEPSGFDVKMRPAARSMKNSRPESDFTADFTVSDLEALVDGIGFFIPFLVYFAYRACFSRTDDYLSKRRSHESAEASDGFAENQVLHLKRAFVGVERFGIGEE